MIRLLTRLVVALERIADELATANALKIVENATTKETPEEKRSYIGMRS